MPAKKRPAKPGRRSRAGRPPVVEGRPDRDEIFAALMVSRPNYAAISRERDVSVEALKGFEGRTIPPPVRESLDRTVDSGDVLAAQLNVIAEATDGYRKFKLLVDGFDRWLQDPEDPKRYSVSPREHEVLVIWEREVDNGNGKLVMERHRDTLAAILRYCRERSPGTTPDPEEIVMVESRVFDPRKGMLDQLNASKPMLEMLGKALGQIRPDPVAQVNVVMEHPQFRRVLDALYQAALPYPECLEAQRRALEGIVGGERG